MSLMMSSDKVRTRALTPHLPHEGPSWECQTRGHTNFLIFQGISAFPDGDNLLSWIGTVEGPKESVYEGLTYKLRLEFPAGNLTDVPERFNMI